MIDQVRDAMRVLLASTIVQCCEAVDERLARWSKGLVAGMTPITRQLLAGKKRVG